MFVAEAALIALREGLEAFLIVGILLGFVTKLGRRDARTWVWTGLAAGILTSILLGVLVQVFLVDVFENRGGGEWFELVAALVAVGVLTYMVVWMWKHTRGLMVELRERVGDALAKNMLWAVGVLVFVSVLREGLEVVLFYAALVQRHTALDLAWSGIVGTLASVGIVGGIFWTTTSFNLQRFFAATGILLVFVAAGLLVHSVHAATALGVLDPAPALWDTGRMLSDDGAAGRVLHALTGYTAQPTLLQALLYLGYLFGVGIWYLSSLGFYHRRPAGTLRLVRVAATALLILLATVFTAAGTARPAGIFDHGHGGGSHSLGHDDAATPHDVLLANASRALASYPGKVGILIRDHGEQVRYNASTYESIKQFVRDIWPYTGLPPELLSVDQGSYFIDADHPFAKTPQTAARLVDPWLTAWTLPAAPASDPSGSGAMEEFCDHDPVYYFIPGAGPGQGEGDLFELIGLCAYREWIKMDNHSPRYEQGVPVWDWLEYHLQKHFGGKVVVAFAHGVDPKMDPNETLDAAARFLVSQHVSVVLDAYQSSIHSDGMNTCMMRPHAEHALHEAGFHGPILTVGQPGFDPAWARAVADQAERLVANASTGERVSIHLTHHGGNPASENPCGSGPDQYHANARRQYDAVSRVVAQRLEAHGNVTLRFVYGQGAGGADDGVLGPLEAVDLDRAAGIRSVAILPYEVWGDGVDSLVAIRESLGFQPSAAPYYDASYETDFTDRGVHVHVASANFGIFQKSEALLGQIGLAIQALTPEAA